MRTWLIRRLVDIPFIPWGWWPMRWRWDWSEEWLREYRDTHPEDHIPPPL